MLRRLDAFIASLTKCHQQRTQPGSKIIIPASTKASNIECNSNNIKEHVLDIQQIQQNGNQIGCSGNLMNTSLDDTWMPSSALDENLQLPTSSTLEHKTLGKADQNETAKGNLIKSDETAQNSTSVDLAQPGMPNDCLLCSRTTNESQEEIGLSKDIANNHLNAIIANACALKNSADVKTKSQTTYGDKLNSTIAVVPTNGGTPLKHSSIWKQLLHENAEKNQLILGDVVAKTRDVESLVIEVADGNACPVAVGDGCMRKEEIVINVIVNECLPTTSTAAVREFEIELANNVLNENACDQKIREVAPKNVKNLHLVNVASASKELVKYLGGKTDLFYPFLEIAEWTQLFVAATDLMPVKCESFVRDLIGNPSLISTKALSTQRTPLCLTFADEQEILERAVLTTIRAAGVFGNAGMPILEVAKTPEGKKVANLLLEAWLKTLGKTKKPLLNLFRTKINGCLRAFPSESTLAHNAETVKKSRLPRVFQQNHAEVDAANSCQATTPALKKKRLPISSLWRRPKAAIVNDADVITASLLDTIPPRSIMKKPTTTFAVPGTSSTLSAASNSLGSAQMKNVKSYIKEVFKTTIGFGRHTTVREKTVRSFQMSSTTSVSGPGMGCLRSKIPVNTLKRDDSSRTLVCLD
ncbi:hypothetical protein HDU97_000681 [Phlyctochytrium planicorne]|nr:hypothetical protein HDU97_000681 [Phlyctochytrium planicorne]